ncbi:MAG TPA: hypothetical protein VEF71_07805 [Streptosporangiaceae bacterium]|nr:hypothetical protein [Streptosporangiaceae bacterium]
MNEMELLRDLAQETPLPAPADLDAARARLLAAITTDPATYATAVAQVTTSPPGPPDGRPAGPLRPAAPAPVLTAAKFMHAGAIGTAALLIVVLAFSWDINLYHWTTGHGHQDTTAQLRQLRPLIITVVAAYGLVVTAMWLWMARATSRGKNWARILSTVLFGLATLQLTGNQGVLDMFFAVLTWLTALPAVWLLWRPASSAFFKSAKAARSRPPSHISGP